MKKKILFICLIFTLSGCFKEDLPVEAYQSSSDIFTNQVEVGPFYRNQVFFDLETNKIISSNDRSVWDLAFVNEVASSAIFLNSSKFMKVGITNSTDFVTCSEKEIYEWKFDNPSGDKNESALSSFIVDFDNLKTATKKVFFIDRGYTPDGNEIGLIKLQIINFTDSTYSIKFCNVSNNIIYEHQILKSELTSFNYFSFDDGGKTVKVAPPKTQWDLQFTQYTTRVQQTATGITEDYLVNGVLLNTESTFAVLEDLKEFDQINHKDLPNYSLSNQYDVIGYDWKEYNFQTQSYEILDDNTYLIKTQEGNFFKLRFTSFLNNTGERGFPTFNFSKF